METDPPLYPLLQEILGAAHGGMPFLAIAMAVALPDICASLSSDDGRTSPTKYKDWCRENLGKEFSYLTPDDLYSMRCGVLHNGRFGDMKHSVARVIFVPPNDRFTLVNGVMNDAYVYSWAEFCENFVVAVHRWFEAHKDDDVVKANLPRMMQYRAEGLRPYIVGMTVIA